MYTNYIAINVLFTGGGLDDVANPGAEDDITSVVDSHSVEVIEHAALEASLKSAKVGDSFQFEREGYFCVDSKHSAENQPVFNLTVALRETKKVQA